MVFGITGGSGAGKGAVSDIFRALGVYVIDADAVGHEVTNSRECLDELTARFGKNILNSDGTIDRRVLGNIVFAGETELVALNSITHKYIRDKIAELIENSGAELCAIDGAVIIGSVVEPLCEFIVAVTADRETRIKRITERDSITRESAVRRIDAQPGDEFYIKNARYIIENNKGKDDLQREVYSVYRQITGK